MEYYFLYTIEFYTHLFAFFYSSTLQYTNPFHYGENATHRHTQLHCYNRVNKNQTGQGIENLHTGRLKKFFEFHILLKQVIIIVQLYILLLIFFDNFYKRLYGETQALRMIESTILRIRIDNSNKWFEE